MENKEKELTSATNESVRLDNVGKNEEIAYRKERTKGIIALVTYLAAQTIIAIIVMVAVEIILGIVYPDVFRDLNSTDVYFKDQAEEFILGKTNFYVNILIAFGLFVSLGALFFKGIIKDVKRTFSKDFLFFFVIVCVGFVLAIFGSSIGSMITEAIFGKSDSNNQLALEEMISVPSQTVLMGFMIVIFAPVYEELIFRRAIFALFRNTKKGNIIALFVSTFLFAAVHVVSQGDFEMIITYIIPAFIFASTYYISKRNILTTMTIHFANNLMAFVSILLLSYIA